jgi:hypothetical protein
MDMRVPLIISKVQRETNPGNALASTAPARKNPMMTGMGAAQDTIRARAYQIFESRGYEHGHDVQDWLSAEHQIHAR